MGKPESSKVFLMLLGLVLQVFSCSTPAKTTAPQTVAPYAGDIVAPPLAQGITVEAGELKALILRPAGWEAIAKYPGAVTFIDIVFKEAGEQVKVKLGGGRRDCERDVIFISSDTLQFDGCVDRGITLKRDISDDVWKLKGTSKMGADLKLKEVDAK